MTYCSKFLADFTNRQTYQPFSAVIRPAKSSQAILAGPSPSLQQKCILSSFLMPNIRLQRVQQIVRRKDALTRVAAYAIASAFLRLAGGAL